VLSVSSALARVLLLRRNRGPGSGISEKSMSSSRRASTRFQSVLDRLWYCLSSRRVAFPGEMIRMVSGLGSVKIRYAVRPRIEPIPIQRFSPYSSRLSGSTTSTPRNISSAPTKSQPCSRMFARFLVSSHSSHVVTPNVATGKEQHSDHPCAIRKTVWWASHNRGTFAP